MKPISRWIGVGAVVILLAALAGPALAAEEADVARAINSQGFFVDSGVSISDADLSRLVEHASFEGEFVYFAVLGDNPLGGATLFAEDVADRIDDGLLVVLTPESVGYGGSTTYSGAEIESALDAADATGGSDLDYLTTFIEALTGVPVEDPVGSGAGTATTAAPQPASGSSGGAQESSGGGSGFLWFILIAAAVGLFFWWMVRRGRKKPSRQPAMNERIVQARAVVQKQLDDVANDVLDLAEEVQVADNPQASEYYQQASATYAAASDEFPAANDAQSIIDLSQRLDEAIWQLDAAEAILDGNPVPPKPVKEPIVVEPEPAATSPQPRPSYPSYERRPTRRSSYGGSGLFDILIGVGSVLASSRGSRGGGLFGGRGGGGLFGSRAQTPQPRSKPAGTRGGSSGGGLFGRMGRVDTGGSSKPRSSGSSTRRSTSRSSRPRSKVRGGRRRRG